MPIGVLDNIPTEERAQRDNDDNESDSDKRNHI